MKFDKFLRASSISFSVMKNLSYNFNTSRN